MTKKMKLFVLLIAATGIVSAVLFASAGRNTERPPSADALVEKESTGVLVASDDGGDYNIDACYTDGCESFTELKNTAAYIVKATAISLRKAELGQISTLSVSETYKGKVSSEIIIYQILGDNNVEIGKEYILFLNEQTPGEAPDNDYYPISGGAGAMLYDSNNSTVTVSYPKHNSPELKAWLTEKVGAGKGEFKILG